MLFRGLQNALSVLPLLCMIAFPIFADQVPLQSFPYAVVSPAQPKLGDRVSVTWYLGETSSRCMPSYITTVSVAGGADGVVTLDLAYERENGAWSGANPSPGNPVGYGPVFDLGILQAARYIIRCDGITMCEISVQGGRTGATICGIVRTASGAPIAGALVYAVVLPQVLDADQASRMVPYLHTPWKQTIAGPDGRFCAVLDCDPAAVAVIAKSGFTTDGIAVWTPGMDWLEISTPEMSYGGPTAVSSQPALPVSGVQEWCLLKGSALQIRLDAPQMVHIRQSDLSGRSIFSSCALSAGEHLVKLDKGKSAFCVITVQAGDRRYSAVAHH